jgi:hypothetical protein
MLYISGILNLLLLLTIINNKNMKFLIIISLITFINLPLIAQQPFEGLIVYKNSIKSKTPNVTDQLMEESMGRNIEYRVRNGYYKSTSDGNRISWQIFNPKENKIYTQMTNVKSVYWNDCAVKLDEVYKSEIKKGAAVILGYTCDELTLTCKSGVQKYYYHPVLSVNPDDYKNHSYANWNAFTQKSKAFPLKIVIETSQFILTSTATKISVEKINPRIFELPMGTVLEKSPN